MITFFCLTDNRLSSIQFANDELKSLNKSHGCGNISIQMLPLCMEYIHIPLGINFSNIIKTGIFPDQWKLANVTPIRNKDDKQLP